MVARGGRGKFRAFGVPRNAGRPFRTGASVARSDDAVSASMSSVTVSTASAVNDGTTVTVTVTVLNAEGVPLTGKSVTIASTGSNNTLVQPSSTTDANGQATGTISSTTAEAKTISATAGGTAITDTATVTFVTGLTPVFFSDWSTGTGTSNSARGDGGKWDLLGGYGQEVVASTGLDFPSTNVMKINANYANSGFALNRTTGMSVPSAGTTRYYRWYVRMTFPDDLVGNGDHPWQDGNAVGDCNWLCGVHYGSDSPGSHLADWQIGPTFLTNTNGSFDNGPWLTKGVTYRVECALERLDSTTYDFAIRVYASDADGGALLYDSADFPADAGGGTVETRGPWTFRTAANLDGFNCGTNDFETAGNAWWNAAPYSGVFVYGYQGCVAIVDKTESISTSDWVGPYGTVTGEA